MQFRKNWGVIYCKLPYFDGTIKIKWNDRDLPYRIFDKIQKVDQGEIVSNKRLGAVLNFIKEKQDKIDEKRSTSSPSRQHLGEVNTTIIKNASKTKRAIQKDSINIY